MKRRVAKTTGLQWLEYSLNAFNGSGYADYESPEAFVDSYIIYKKWKKKPEAAELAVRYWAPALAVAEHLIDYSDGPNRAPSDKNLAKFRSFQNTLF